MAEYKSQFKNLSFYVEGEKKQFSNGAYSTDSKKEIEVLEKLDYVAKVEEPKKETPKEEVKKVEEKPKTTNRKTPSTK